MRTQVSMKVFKKIQGGSSSIYKCYIEYINSIDKRWLRDNIILTLLLAIVLFTPDRPDIEESDIIEYVICSCQLMSQLTPSLFH